MRDECIERVGMQTKPRSIDYSAEIQKFEIAPLNRDTDVFPDRLSFSTPS